ncbi:PAS domain S-box protein [Acuticoccus kandeliae]|uniref:PAS domain S-box protein n=1 Tax=Acuticoccus kandeliae TaxID=2073160 RepID=UPI001474765E|nr:PAS domain S-box protein [Acuticoccus kandeliae]
MISLIGMVLVTSISVGVLVYSSVIRAVSPQGALRIQANVEQLASIIDGRTYGIRYDVEALRGTRVVESFLRSIEAGDDPANGDEADSPRGILSDLFLSILAAKPDYLQLRILGTDGRELARVHRTGANPTPVVVPLAALQDKEARDYVSATRALPPGGVYVSPIDLNREFGVVEEPHMPVLRVAAPLDLDGERVGLLIINVDMRSMLSRIRDGTPDDGTLFVLNDTGGFLLHPDPARDFGFDLGDAASFADDHPNLAAIVPEEGAGSSLAFAGDDQEVAVAWAGARLAGGPRVRVVEAVPTHALNAESAVGWPALIGAALATGVAIVLAALLSRAIARPIAQMTDAVRDLEDGGPAELPVTSGGEVGVLANAMAAYIERERWHVAVIETTSDAVIATRMDGTIIQWNASAAELFGIPAEDAIGHAFEAVISEELSPELCEIRRRATAAEFVGNTEIAIQTGVDVLLDLSVTASQVFSADWEPIGVSLIMRNVTDRKVAEEMFRLSVEQSPAGMLLVDRSGAIVLANGEVERQFGYAKSELIGSPVEMLVPANIRAQHPTLMEGFFAAPQRRPMGADRELLGARKDGDHFDIEVGLTPVPHRSGLLVLAAIVDITEKKKAERELARRTLDLERSNADLEQFAYIASHDLQEPLRMVASFTQLLSDRYKGQLDERADKYIHFAVDGAKRMQQLINDLLIYSRVGSEAKPLAPVDLSHVWMIVAAELSGLIEDAGAEVTAGPLPVVLADQAQLTRLLQNLLSNALKFRGEAVPRVHLDAHQDGETWVLSLTDNGIGFETGERERIFEMFQRLHERGRYGGTGLGLAICKRIVSQHGGRIWADSTPGEGSTFHFTLQAVQHSEVPA